MILIQICCLYAQKNIFFRGLQSQYSMYPTAAAAMSQIDRERLGIPGHHVGLDPIDPMVNSEIL